MEPSRLRRHRKRRRAANLTLAVASFVVGSLFLTDQKQVILVVDGQSRQLRTLTDDVGQLLSTTGVVVRPRAVVTPVPNAPLEDGMVIVVDSAGEIAPGDSAELTFLRLDTEGKWESRFIYEEMLERQRLRLEAIRERREARRERIQAIRDARERRRARAEEKRRAEEAAAAAAAAEAARIAAAAAAPHSDITGCNIDWRGGPAEVAKLIRCAVERWSVPGGAEKAIEIASCESGMNPYRQGSGVGGVFQHSILYWPERAARFGFANYSVYNGRANVMVAIQYAHVYGWGAWSCA
ncbi:MAG: ubiquitin-like domain-containing protein [Actinomycetota bacterium]